MCVYTCVHMCVCVGVCVYTCMCAYMCVDYMCVYVCVYNMCVYIYMCIRICLCRAARQSRGSAFVNAFGRLLKIVSRLLKMVGLFCTRALLKRLYSAKETYNFNVLLFRECLFVDLRIHINMCNYSSVYNYINIHAWNMCVYLYICEHIHRYIYICVISCVGARESPRSAAFPRMPRC